MRSTDHLTELAMSAREGDDRSIEQLVRLTQSDVWRVCAALGSEGEVEDLVSETYLRALRSLPSFRGESSVRTWLLTIARNVCADHVRTRVRSRRLMGRLRLHVTESVDDGPSYSDDLLGSLDPDRREAFQLTQVAGLSYAETAELLDVPVGTIRSRVARARLDLRTAIDIADAN